VSTVYLLGAGASHAYDGSRFGVRPPSAKGFFDAYSRLPISEDFDVKVGAIVNFARDYYGIDPASFLSFSEDVESFMSRVDEVIELLRARLNPSRGPDRKPDPTAADFYAAYRAKFEMLLLFSRVLTDTTDGPPCRYHSALVAGLREGDTVISFNWDPLLERALHGTGLWFPDDGYGISFDLLFDGEWRDANPGVHSQVQLLKLHGSVSWLICLPGFEGSTGEEYSGLPQERFHDKFCFVRAPGEPHYTPRAVLLNPLAPKRRTDSLREITVNVRIVPQGTVVRGPQDVRIVPEIAVFDDYTASSKMTSLIIPPTHRKNYDDLPGRVFEELWPKALEALANSDRTVIIGYSLPKTDERSRWLLRQAARLRATPWRIDLVTPTPVPLQHELAELVGTRKCDVVPVADSFQAYTRRLEAV